ncbi:helix-turn-helix domain-containing protein [Corynebacterium parakroppenstedtii]|uniref:helix-turn-helix domain-containing protein n=1 Tax=Corynebacterium parakroppenstedtii TaxID=2828363 RepID=UPI0036F35219
MGTKVGKDSLHTVMRTQTTVLDNPALFPHHQSQGNSPVLRHDSENPLDGAIGSSAETPEPLLRETLGEALRAFRVRASMTLRELSDVASVSPGYLSEIERGRKEVSSELLASVCHALGVRVSDVLLECISIMALEAEAVDFRHELDATV